MKKFVFPESTKYLYKNIRIESELNDRLENLLEQKQISFSDFVSAALEYTMDIIDEQETSMK